MEPKRTYGKAKPIEDSVAQDEKFGQNGLEEEMDDNIMGIMGIEQGERETSLPASPMDETHNNEDNLINMFASDSDDAMEDTDYHYPIKPNMNFDLNNMFEPEKEVDIFENLKTFDVTNKKVGKMRARADFAPERSNSPDDVVSDYNVLSSPSNEGGKSRISLNVNDFLFVNENQSGDFYENPNALIDIQDPNQARADEAQVNSGSKVKKDGSKKSGKRSHISKKEMLELKKLNDQMIRTAPVKVDLALLAPEEPIQPTNDDVPENSAMSAFFSRLKKTKEIRKESKIIEKQREEKRAQELKEKKTLVKKTISQMNLEELKQMHLELYNRKSVLSSKVKIDIANLEVLHKKSPVKAKPKPMNQRELNLYLINKMGDLTLKKKEKLQQQRKDIEIQEISETKDVEEEDDENFMDSDQDIFDGNESVASKTSQLDLNLKDDFNFDMDYSQGLPKTNAKTSAVVSNFFTPKVTNKVSIFTQNQATLPTAIASDSSLIQMPLPQGNLDDLIDILSDDSVIQVPLPNQTFSPGFVNDLSIPSLADWQPAPGSSNDQDLLLSSKNDSQASGIILDEIIHHEPGAESDDDIQVIYKPKPKSNELDEEEAPQYLSDSKPLRRLIKKSELFQTLVKTVKTTRTEIDIKEKRLFVADEAFEEDEQGEIVLHNSSEEEEDEFDEQDAMSMVSEDVEVDQAAMRQLQLEHGKEDEIKGYKWLTRTNKKKQNVLGDDDDFDSKIVRRYRNGQGSNEQGDPDFPGFELDVKETIVAEYTTTNVNNIMDLAMELPNYKHPRHKLLTNKTLSTEAWIKAFNSKDHRESLLRSSLSSSKTTDVPKKSHSMKKKNSNYLTRAAESHRANYRAGSLNALSSFRTYLSNSSGSLTPIGSTNTMNESSTKSNLELNKAALTEQQRLERLKRQYNFEAPKDVVTKMSKLNTRPGYTAFKFLGKKSTQSSGSLNKNIRKD